MNNIYIDRYMITLEERKKHTKYLTEITENFLFNITKNNALSAYYLIIFHWIITGIPLMYIVTPLLIYAKEFQILCRKVGKY